MRHFSARAGLLALATSGILAVSATAGSEHSCASASCEAAAAATTPAITAAGVGRVTLGSTYASLRRAGRLGKVAPGCELAGPRARSAPLLAPLVGSVDLTLGSPRRVASISVRGGATARGVGIGASAAEIRAAFPRAVFDHRSEAVFGLTFARVPKGAGGRLELGVDTTTKQVTIIAIPRIALCE